MSRDVCDYDSMSSCEHECDPCGPADAEKDDEYPPCEDCRNTGHPWIEGAELGMSGPDYRYWCCCPQGQDMRIAEVEKAAP